MKKTKRKGFNFLSSYFDVLNQLETNSDKLNFLLSVINKQFLDQDPEGLNFVVKLAYESQRHQIESSVKGYKDKMKTELNGNPLQDPPEGGTQGGMVAPSVQEEEKGKEQEKGKGKRFTPPTFEELKSYFLQNGYSIQSARKAFDYYEAAKWKDSKGNQVKNWKQKMIGVWFKEENKQTATGPVKRKAKGYNEQGQVIDQFGEVIS
jgi:hypothetical protein